MGGHKLRNCRIIIAEDDYPLAFDLSAWIEQLATKKSSIGADRTIAASVSGFSPEAQTGRVSCGHFSAETFGNCGCRN